MHKSRHASLWLTLSLLLASALGAFRLLNAPPTAHSAISPNIVISQIYGGGGNSGAPFTHDFIELFNRGTMTVNISGWSVQYASATSSSWAMTTLTGSIMPGQYYLIRGSGGATGAALPTPDVIGTLPLAVTAGKVALVNNSTLLTGSGCPFAASVIDFIGYGGTANCSETAPAPAPASGNNATAILRASAGCTETDNNATDFSTGPPNPRNTTSPIAVCGAPTNPTGTGAASPSMVPAGNVVLLTVNVTPGTNPASTSLTVTADLTTISGAAAQVFLDDGMNGDAAAGDNVFSFRTQIPISVTPGPKSLPVTITDAQSRTGNTTINFTVLAPLSPSAVVVSQVYGAGGNTGAAFMNDFIELFIL